MQQYEEKARLMDEVSISRALMRLSHEILEKNGGADGLLLIGVKRRGYPIARRIAQNIERIVGIRYVRLAGMLAGLEKLGDGRKIAPSLQ